MVMISGSFGAWLSAMRRSWIAFSGRSASIAPLARSFSASTWFGSPAITVSTRLALSAAAPVSASIWASASCRSRVASEGAAPSSSWRSAAIAGLGAALGEVEPGQRPLERAGVGGGGDAGLELGPGGLGAADLEQELRQRQRRLRVAGAARRGGAQHRLGGRRGRPRAGATGSGRAAPRGRRGRARPCARARRRRRPCRRPPRARRGAPGAGPGPRAPAPAPRR